jgi:hypothetical protein
MATPTLWIYQRDDGKWIGHVDWKDNTRIRRQGPFNTEAQAAVAISRMNGMEPPEDMVCQYERERMEGEVV